MRAGTALILMMIIVLYGVLPIGMGSASDRQPRLEAASGG